MKVYEEEISGADKHRILFAVGIDELKLIKGLIDRYLTIVPRGDDWKPEQNRARNITRAISRYLNKPNKKIRKKRKEEK